MADNGFGLDGVLKTREQDLYAVLNGVDYSLWDPANDPFLPAPYTEKTVENKRVCKTRLQEIFHLKKKGEIPVVGLIARLLDRKGFDLVSRVLPRLMESEIELILMGKGQDQYQNWAREMVEKYPGLVGLEMVHSESMAHQIQAGADILLMPSRYEPCGLDQLHALRYGTIPVVRAVGGLEDTVEDYNPQTERGTGFKFKEYEWEKLLQTIQRALAVYRDKPRWKRLIQRAMNQDFSWEKSAAQYEALYQKALLKRGTGPRV
jgi:starch synthase